MATGDLTFPRPGGRAGPGRKPLGGAQSGPQQPVCPVGPGGHEPQAGAGQPPPTTQAPRRGGVRVFKHEPSLQPRKQRVCTTHPRPCLSSALAQSQALWERVVGSHWVSESCCGASPRGTCWKSDLWGSGKTCSRAGGFLLESLHLRWAGWMEWGDSSGRSNGCCVLSEASAGGMLCEPGAGQAEAAGAFPPKLSVTLC